MTSFTIRIGWFGTKSIQKSFCLDLLWYCIREPTVHHVRVEALEDPDWHCLMRSIPPPAKLSQMLAQFLRSMTSMSALSQHRHVSNEKQSSCPSVAGRHAALYHVHQQEGDDQQQSRQRPSS